MKTALNILFTIIIIVLIYFLIRKHYATDPVSTGKRMPERQPSRRDLLTSGLHRRRLNP